MICCHVNIVEILVHPPGRWFLLKKYQEHAGTCRNPAWWCWDLGVLFIGTSNLMIDMKLVFVPSCFVGNLVWTMLCLLDTYHVWSLRACIQRAIFAYPLYLHTIWVNSKPRHCSPSMIFRQGTILKLPYFRLGTCNLARLPCQYIGLVSDWRFKKHANMISMGLMLPLLFLCILWRTTLPVPFDVAGVADVAGWDV